MKKQFIDNPEPDSRYVYIQKYLKACTAMEYSDKPNYDELLTYIRDLNAEVKRLEEEERLENIRLEKIRQEEEEIERKKIAEEEERIRLIKIKME